MKRGHSSEKTPIQRTKRAKKSKNSQSIDTAKGITFRKCHGQHILRNPSVIKAIIDKSGIAPTDTVLEIGPGTGVLTESLLAAAKKVICIEIDERMVSELRKKFQKYILQKKLQIIQGNCLHVDFPYFDRCVANVPYNISSGIVFKLLQGGPKFHKPTEAASRRFKCAVLMFQKEFAQRLVAKPGDAAYSRLSVNTQLLANVSHLMKVGRKSFVPPPKVDSSVVRIDPKRTVPDISLAEWDELMKVLFNRKNKKVSSVLRKKKLCKRLHENHKSHCALEGSVPVDNENFVANITEIVKGKSFCNDRAKSMPIENLAWLLSSLHAKGIYFT